MEPTGPDLLRALVALGRAWYSADLIAGRKPTEPQPGDLVVEVTGLHRMPDPDAIGFLVGEGMAPWGEDDPLDGSVPMRHVWDVRPLSGARGVNGSDVQRWENATFVALPERVAALFSSDATPDLIAMTRRTTDMLTEGER